MPDPYADPSSLDWLPLRHACGCILEWGVPLGQRRVFDQLLPRAAVELCPLNSKDKRVPHEELGAKEIHNLVPGMLWYRLAPAARHADGRINRRLALRV
jgi:hypothetical protein